MRKCLTGVGGAIANQVDISIVAAPAACQAELKAGTGAERGLGAITLPAREHDRHTLREGLVLVLLQSTCAHRAADFT